MIPGYIIQLDVDEHGYHITVHNVHGMTEGTFGTARAALDEITTVMEVENARA